MFKLDKDTGDITCFQGDSGELYIYDAPDDAVISFSVYDKNRNIKFEVFATTNNTTDANKTRIFITPDNTDLLTVSKKDEYSEYYYGIKLTQKIDNERIEKTFLINNKTADELNTMYVYPKRNEGKNDL